MEEKLKTMEKEKENMASHLASTLKENQSRTAVIEEKMEAEKEELRRAMEQRDQEKLEVLPEGEEVPSDIAFLMQTVA